MPHSLDDSLARPCQPSPTPLNPPPPHPTHPAVSDLIELVGVGVTGWFTYRYLTVGPDR
jgi:hypothetical protein